MDEVFEFFEGQSGFYEVSAVSTYAVWAPGGEVEVAIHDRGADEGRTRYAVLAKYVDSSDRPELEMNAYGLSLGNSDATIQGALFNVHWNVFREVE